MKNNSTKTFRFDSEFWNFEPFRHLYSFFFITVKESSRESTTPCSLQIRLKIHFKLKSKRIPLLQTQWECRHERLFTYFNSQIVEALRNMKILHWPPNNGKNQSIWNFIRFSSILYGFVCVYAHTDLFERFSFAWNISKNFDRNLMLCHNHHHW